MATLPGKVQTPVVNMVVTPDNETQTGVISEAIFKAFEEIEPSTQALRDAQTAVKNETKFSNNKRANILVGLAALSTKHQWDVNFISDACTHALNRWNAKKNAKDTTVRQFGSEIRRAMHPVVRSDVKDIFEAVNKAWSVEREAFDKWDNLTTEQKKTITKPADPLAKAFQRAYHAVAGSKGALASKIEVATATKKNPTKLTQEQADDIHQLAAARGTIEREDPNRAAKIIKGLSERLAEVYAEFPHKNLKTVLDVVTGFDASMLEKAKAQARARTTNEDNLAALAAIKAAQLTAKGMPITAGPVAEEPEDDGGAEDEHESLEGAVDNLIDE